MERNTFLLNTIAKALNVGGSALVSAYDAGAGAFNCTMSALSPGEKSKLRSRIKAHEKQIQALYSQLARESAKYSDPTAALEAPPVMAITAAIKELSADVEAMKQHLAEIEAVKVEQVKPAKPAAKSAPQESGGVAAFFIKSISSTIAGYLPGERSSLERKIAENDKKIQTLYSDFAKESAKYQDPAAALASDTVAAIIARINELKSENEALKLRIAELSEDKKSFKAPLKEKAAPTAEAAPAVVSTPAVTCEPAVICEPAVVVAATAAVAVAVAEQISEQSDPSTIDYTRAKPCLIPTPTLQPPTREDIENETRSTQPESAPVEAISEITVEPVIEEVAAHSVEESPVAEEVPAEIEEVANVAEVEEAEEIAEVEEVAEAAVIEEEAPGEAKAPTEVEPAVEIAAVEETVAEEVAATEEEPVEDEAPSTTEVQPETTDQSDQSDQSDEPPTTDEITEPVEKLSTIDVPLAELEKKKITIIERPVTEKGVWGNFPTIVGDFSSVRTKGHASTFVPPPESAQIFTAPVHKPEPIIFTDENEPVFRTRVHHTSVAAAVSESAPLATTDSGAPLRQKSVVFEAVAPQHQAGPPATSEDGPVFRARVHHNAHPGIEAEPAVIAVEKTAAPVVEKAFVKKEAALKKQPETKAAPPQKAAMAQNSGKKTAAIPVKQAVAASSKNKPKKRG